MSGRQLETCRFGGIHSQAEPVITPATFAPTLVCHNQGAKFRVRFSPLGRPAHLVCDLGIKVYRACLHFRFTRFR
jgi:hypothetical protein